MTEFSKNQFKIPPEQQAIRDKCFHPSGTFVEFPIEDVETSIPERFEKIVRLYPDRLAVKDKDRSLTYNELNKNANRIARAILEKRGPGSEPIALLFEHGIDVIVAIFGVLKAGKFYVALDPRFPLARLRYILKDSLAETLVTNNCNANLGRELITEHIQSLNTDDIVASHPVENFGSLSISPDALGNITYTSGSTGDPKGVVLKHRQAIQFGMLGTARRGINEQDRLSLVHSVSFSSAFTDLFQSLLNGAALCLYDLKANSIESFAKFLDEETITICHLSPDTYRLLVGPMSKLRHLSYLRLICLSGAPIVQADYDLYRHELPNTILLEVGMGSTEAGRICSAILGHDFIFPKEGTPIGYPSLGKKILILDEARREVSPGEIGEIAVKGANLNPGYWRRADLTSEKYLTDPNDGNERIYLTGDLGRVLPDGFVTHLGRKDLMVKIRGHRVHLTEVEGVLLEHSQVKEAGVAAWERDPGEKYLVGYIVPREESALNVSELKEFLRKKLPDYMVPSPFMFLESLPLTNGKLNRSALPKPGNNRPNLNVAYQAPRNDIERKLSRIWREVLAIDEIGVEDNFFDLGGHSLAASRVISRVIQTFQLELPVKALFEAPTVAEMAVIITERQGKQLGEEELERLLGELESMSDEEVRQLVAKEAVKE